jgi:hypothetical protein
VQQRAATGYEWRKHPNDPGRWYLYNDGAMVGGWDVPEGYFVRFANGAWETARSASPAVPPGGQPAAKKQEAPKGRVPDSYLPSQLAQAPGSPPTPKAAKPPEITESYVQNFGVDISKLKNDGGEPEYTINGVTVTKKEAYAAMQNKSLTDDSKLPWVTAIGSATDCVKVWNALTSTGLAGKVRYQSYRTEDPIAKSIMFNVGFKPEGSPQVVVQKPAGEVTLRQSSWSNPETLVAAVRKADPSYDPNKDPDGKPPMPAPPGPIKLPDMSSGGFTLLALLAMGAVMAIIYVMQQRKQA